MVHDFLDTLYIYNFPYLQITCALVEIFQVEETEEQVMKCYHRLFAALMVRIGSSIGVEPLKAQTLVGIHCHGLFEPGYFLRKCLLSSFWYCQHCYAKI